MKPLNKATHSNSLDTTLDLKAVPANLHDVAEEVFGDTLYTLYTVSSEVVGTEVKVSIIASDLIKHTAGNGVKGYWVGIGIPSELFEDASAVYAGWGSPVDTELIDPTEPDGEQETNGKLYKTFYFNAENANKHENTGYVVIDRSGIHYHYSVDFSQVKMSTEAGVVEDVSWNAVSVSSIKNKYLFGIDLSDNEGNPLPEELLIHYLNSAVEYIQNLLDIVISETEFTERHDYIRNDYQNWGFIQLDHNPVKEVKRLTLMYGDKRSVEIPLDWIQLDKLTGQITLFPSAGSANSLIIGQTGMLFGFQSQWDYAPSLWEVEYVAGFDENDKSLPLGLMTEAIYKRAACGILNVWGDLIIGAGIASQSVKNRYSVINVA